MYTDTVFSAALGAVPGKNAPISCPHVSVSQGRSSRVHVVARKLLHCGYNDHALRTKATNTFLCT
jgi:hypothetical protein